MAGVIVFQKSIDQRHRCGAIYVVIAIDQNFLLPFGKHGHLQARNGPVHILHVERIVQMTDFRTKKRAGFFVGLYTPLHQQSRQKRS